jgi:peroxiredoxin
MFKQLMALITCTLLSTSALAAAEIGQAAPSFSVIDSQGVTHSLHDFTGKTVILEWTNHDCPFVKKHYETDNMQSLQREMTAQGAVWLSVISSAPGTQGFVSAAQANQLSADRNAAPTAVLLDSSGMMGRAYQARVTPHMYVIDSKGILRYAGGIDSIATANKADVAKADPYFATAARAVLAGEPVERSISRPYGCTVKYVD